MNGTTHYTRGGKVGGASHTILEKVKWAGPHTLYAAGQHILPACLDMCKGFHVYSGSERDRPYGAG